MVGIDAGRRGEGDSGGTLCAVASPYCWSFNVTVPRTAAGTQGTIDLACTRWADGAWVRGDCVLERVRVLNSSIDLTCRCSVQGIFRVEALLVSGKGFGGGVVVARGGAKGNRALCHCF